ncbi:MAG: glycine cleavage system protein H [Candidatus Margulisbacteria bacterium GWF2_35_9]|nr:MAG: glycine cleavage system protein H [Candidatus Margulisbacteria bacterium GWF2_35_9]
MSLVMNKFYYTEEHEWLKVEEGNIAVVGITDHAQDSLGDIVFLEMPKEGEDFTQGDEIGVIESVKTVSNLYIPVSGSIIEVNSDVVEDPAFVNSSPYDEGWLVRIEMTEPSELEDLLSADDYTELISKEE